MHIPAVYGLTSNMIQLKLYHFGIIDPYYHWCRLMACCLIGTELLLNQWSLIVNCIPRNKLQRNFCQNTKTFSKENAFHNVCCKMQANLLRPKCVNTLWPSEAMWWHVSVAMLDQVMVCCLTAPSHYLNQCWLIIKGVLWHSPDSNFTQSTTRVPSHSAGMALLRQRWPMPLKNY